MTALSDRRDLNLTVDLCLRVGELMLSNGAGAADVVAAMRLVADHFGLRRAEIDVTFTSISMNYLSEPGEPPLMMIRQVPQRDIDYEDLTRVDHLIRDLLADRLDLSSARAQMASIVSSGHHRHRWHVSAGSGVMCASVAVFLGGGPRVAAIALVAAVVIDRLQLAMQRRRLPFFYRQVAGGAVATLIAVASQLLDRQLNPSLVVTANIVMLLAGIGFMGGLQDALSGFYLTAGARLTEAFLATSGIIAGVSGGLAVGDVAGVGVGRLEPGSTALETLPVLVGGSAVCAAAFGYASYAPRRALLPIGVVAGVAAGVSVIGTDSGFGRTWPTGLAAFLIGLVAYAVSGRFRVPPLVVVVPAVVPMLPGLAIYRGLSLLSGTDARSSAGLVAIVGAAAIALALAAGVILGEYVAQPLKREARRLERRLSGPRLVGPLRGRGRRHAR